MELIDKIKNTFGSVGAIAILCLVAFAAYVLLGKNKPINPRLYQIDLETSGVMKVYDGERLVGEGTIERPFIDSLIINDNQ